MEDVFLARVLLRSRSLAVPKLNANTIEPGPEAHMCLTLSHTKKVYRTLPLLLLLPPIKAMNSFVRMSALLKADLCNAF